MNYYSIGKPHSGMFKVAFVGKTVRADRRNYSGGLPLPGGGTTTVDTPAAFIAF